MGAGKQQRCKALTQAPRVKPAKVSPVQGARRALARVRAHDDFVVANAKSIAPRLWAKVIKKGPNDCWLFTGAKKPEPRAYGCLSMGGRKTVWLAGAHRVCLLLSRRRYRGPEFLAMHRCGKHACVNPGHLYWGTARENVEPALAKRQETDS